MPDRTEQRAGPEQAIVICTRNRTADLQNALESVASCLSEEPPAPHGGPAAPHLLLLVDASEGGAQVHRQHRSLCESLVGVQAAVQYHAYPGRPSLPRQRNYAVEHLPPSVSVVHFIDDDVLVQAGYFRHLAQVLAKHAEIGGVGGLVRSPAAPLSSPPGRPAAAPFAAAARMLVKRLFLISSRTPGHILPSGCSSPPQLPASHKTEPRALFSTEWLGGCATYRRAVLDRFCFEEGLEGVAPFEDRDFSYRAGSAWRLAVEPRAQLVHHASPTDRLARAAYAREHFIHHYWFAMKNVKHPLRRLAFWWAALGRFAAVAVSPRPGSREVLRGLASAARAVLQRDHPTLRLL